MGGRGAGSGASYSIRFEYGIKDRSAGFRKIAQAPVGSRITVHYAEGGSSTYEVRERSGGKKQLVSAESGRGRAISTPSTVKNILGSPVRITVDVKTMSQKEYFQKNRERIEREGDREITSSTYERAQRRAQRNLDNWFGKR